MCPGTSSEIKDADLHQCFFLLFFFVCEHERILSGDACSSLQFLEPLQSELAPFPSQMNILVHLCCSMLLALTCILASPSPCLSLFTEILPIPGHVLAKTVLLQICPVACSNPALHTHSPVPHSRYTLKGSVFQTLVTCIYYFWHSQDLIIQLLP